MRNGKRLLLIGVGAILLIGVAAGLRAQSQDQPTTSTQENSDSSQLPVVDYSAPEPTEVDKRAKRKAKGERYNGRKQVTEPYPEAGDVGILDSWMRSIPALPVGSSDAVVIGEVLDAQAYLSPDKGGIYTEFSVRADEVLKQSGDAAITAGGSIEAQREGGRVRFPSGRQQSYLTHYQGVPRKGRRYVLFLKRSEQGEAFYILTGYELKAGRVHPLDGVDVPKGATELPQFAAYKGADEATFLAELRAAVAETGREPNQ